MYVVKNANGDVIAIASRYEDAAAMASSELDKTTYTIEEVKND